MSRVLIASVLLLFVVSTTRGAEELLPPFGFRWNDPMSRVDAVLKGAKATIISREKKENSEHSLLLKAAPYSASNCNTNIPIGRLNVTTSVWARSVATLTPSTAPEN